jgi:hypothetical protein
VGISGFPEVLDDVFISLTPDEKGRFLTVGPLFNIDENVRGAVAELLAKHIADLHNDSINRPEPKPVIVSVAVPEVSKPKKNSNFWPTGVPQLKHPDGRRMKLKEVREVLAKQEAEKLAAEQTQKTDEVSQPYRPAIAVASEPVQTESSPVEIAVQPQKSEIAPIGS